MSIPSIVRVASKKGRLAKCFSTGSLENALNSLPPQFLRANDASNFDTSTMQRSDVVFDKNTGKIMNGLNSTNATIKKTISRDGKIQVEWSDGHRSEFSVDWIEKQLAKWKPIKHEQLLWHSLSEEEVRSSMSLPFDELLSESGQNCALKMLYDYGILLITDTPITDNGEGVALLASCLSGGSVDKEHNPTSLLSHHYAGSRVLSLPRGTDGPLRTLYGTVWSTSTSLQQAEGSSFADSAYGFDGLPLHTDMTYTRDPPGLQIFTMVQPADKGGESTFGDGFAAAEKLRSEHPESFLVLSITDRTYSCIDKATGWNLQGTGPVLKVRNGQVESIRHNDLDRLPDLPPADCDDVDGFYEALQRAHQQWDEILGHDSFGLVMHLQPGDSMVVANQRCFHGRYGFSGPSARCVTGCYVSQDDLSSRFRMLGLS